MVIQENPTLQFSFQNLLIIHQNKWLSIKLILWKHHTKPKPKPIDAMN